MRPAHFSVQVSVERETVASLRERAASDFHEFLLFKLSGEEHGLNIQSAKDIRSFEISNHVTNMPVIVLGVLNMRSADMGLASACLQ